MTTDYTLSQWLCSTGHSRPSKTCEHIISFFVPNDKSDAKQINWAFGFVFFLEKISCLAFQHWKTCCCLFVGSLSIFSSILFTFLKKAWQIKNMRRIWSILVNSLHYAEFRMCSFAMSKWKYGWFVVVVLVVDRKNSIIRNWQQSSHKIELEPLNSARFYENM